MKHQVTSPQRWVLAIAATASFMVALDALVVSTALSQIKQALNTSIEDLEWTVNAYILSFAVLMMTASALGDRLGRKRLFSAGLGIFAAASAACALSPTVYWLIASRAVQGVGAALVMPLALALLSGAFMPEERPRAMGIFSSVTGFAILCGPLLGGAVVQAIAWPWIFWLNVPLAALLIALTRTHLTESHGPTTNLDPKGLALFTTASLALVWALMRGNAAGWTSLEVSLTAIIGVALATAFTAHELRTDQPMLPLHLFKQRAFSAGNLAMFTWSASVLGTLFFMAQFLQVALSYGPLETGIKLMPWGATTFLVPQLAGRLINKHGERRFAAGGLALEAASLAWLALIASPEVAYWQLVAPLVLSGAGFALAIPALQSAVISSVEPRNIGRASGTLSTVRQLGSVFGVAIVGAVFASTGSYATTESFSHGFSAAIVASGILALLGALAGLALRGAPGAPIQVSARPKREPQPQRAAI